MNTLRSALVACLLLAVPAVAQDDAEDDIALAVSSQVWTVIERDNARGDVWNATWTVRADGRSFDGHWRHTPGGDQGDLTNFAKIKSLQGNTIVISRPGLGEYRGTLSADRKRITGSVSWCNCSWQVMLPSAMALGGSSKSTGTASGSSTVRTTPATPSSSGRTTAPVPKPASPIPRSWSVVERRTDTGEIWNATWTLRRDGMSFDGHWRHTPGGDQGDSVNFATIKSLRGNAIVISRPGLGEYRGTISANRLAISGTTSWCSCRWDVRLQEPLPNALPK